MVALNASDKLLFSLAYRRPTLVQRRFALAVAALQFFACGIVAPFAATPLPRIDSFIPVVLAIIFVVQLITALLLFAQSLAINSRSLFILANGYLFAALIVIPHALTFPGAFAPKGLLGAGVQTSAWLNVSWHFGFLVSIACYAWTKDDERRDGETRPLAPSALYWSLTLVIGLVCALTWGAIAGDKVLPRLFLDDFTITSGARYVTGSILVTSVLLLLLMWSRWTSILDLWIMVAICMVISEFTLVTFVGTARFELVTYVVRTLAMAVSAVVLTVLLSEMIRLYVELSHANTVLEQERTSKLMTIEGAMSSIAHEVSQPLTGVVMNTRAARRWLQRDPPEFDKVTQCLSVAEQASFHASEIIGNIRKLFAVTDQEVEPIDANKLALGARDILRGALNDHGVTCDMELASELPLIMGHKGQLQQVILNLIHNAIDAMAHIEVDRRMLKVRTDAHGGKAIIIEVKDSGEGIKPENLDGIFHAFVTTKAKGTGLGLAISRRIVERHGGQLTAQSDGDNGALFQVILPVEPSALGDRRVE